VPYVRGRERSRSAEAIIEEAKQLIAGGAKDITLLGQNVNSYNGGDGVDIAELMHRICALDGDFKLRFMTSHPKDASDRLIEAMRTEEKIVKHFHLPIQSGSDRIVLADFAHFDVQTLLKESLLLITDYSSVSFDFAYMRKPMVYFQFDPEEFFSKHYSRGYFSYLEMGFGPVVDNVNAVIDAIAQSADNRFVPTDVYSNRMETFFPLYDQKNCERIYQCITGK
jgi:hypothetical protein